MKTTITLADMVLEKTQIVEINLKDLKDLAVLFLEHEVGHCDEKKINADYLSDILTNDWRFYYAYIKTM